MAPTPAVKLDQRPWNEMFLDILVAVVQLLPCVVDSSCFAASCKSWWSAACQAGAAPAVQLPMAVISAPGAAATVLSILSGSARRIHLPRSIAGARLCGSYGRGWFAVAGHNPGGEEFFAVVNLFNDDATVPLPAKMMLLSYSDPRGPRTVCTVVNIHAIAFSAEPASPHCLAAAITGGDHNGIAIARLQDTGAEDLRQRCWIGSTGSSIIQDLIYFDNPLGGSRFHAITNREVLVAAVMGPAHVELFGRRYDVLREADQLLRALPRSIRVTRYLVESRGTLLMVRRYFQRSQANGMNKTLFFRVFQWQMTRGLEEPSSWMEMEGLDGRVLFLARGSSRSFEMQQSSGVVLSGSIYFLDDTKFYGSAPANDKQQNNMDMGMYYMGESGTPLPTEAPNLCSTIFGTPNYVVHVEHEEKIEIKLFEGRKKMRNYFGRKPDAKKEIIGFLWRFVPEPASSCILPPAWFVH